MSHHDHKRQIALILTFTVLILVGLGVSAHAGVKVDLGDNREAFIDFLSKQDNLTREGAAKLAAYCERTSDSRIINEWELPHGTVLDYYHLGRQTPGGPDASYNGSAVLVHRESRLGQVYLRKAYAELTVIERVNKWLGDVFAPNNHMVLVPVGMLSPGQGADVVAAMAGATETRRVAIIATEFPPWHNQSPDQEGNPWRVSLPNRCFSAYEMSQTELMSGASAENIRAFPMYWNLDVNFNRTIEGNELTYQTPNNYAPDWYADSTGGAMTVHTSYSCPPAGLHNPAWDSGPPSPDIQTPPTWYSAEPSNQDWTEFELETNWWNLVFNRANQNSLTNYYYDNSHGNITIEGDRSDIFGWMRSHHVLDHQPYGSNYVYTQQPGTPIIRPFYVEAGHDIYDQRIVRASLDENALSVLFAEDTGVGTPELYAWQRDLNSVISGDQSGYTRIYGPAGASLGNDHYQDPYDSRRHQWLNSGWQFLRRSSDGPPVAYTYVDFDAIDAEGYQFYFVVGAYNPVSGYQYYRWGRNGGEPAGSSPVPGNWLTAYPVDPNPPAQAFVSGNWTSVYRSIRDGSAQLQNTTFSRRDVYVYNPEDTQAWITQEGWALPHPETPAQSLFGSYQNDATGINYGLGNRLKAFWYYHHDHRFEWTSGRPYQLAHLENAAGNIDDIGGTVDSTGHHEDTFYPFNSDYNDSPNQGFGFRPGGAGHDANSMVADINRLLADNGIAPSGYNSIAYLFPSGSSGQHENEGFRMIPRCAGYVLLPENSGLTLAAHEWGHCLFGFVDLYDQDFYNNYMTTTPPDPRHKQCWAMGSYSVMAYGGVRVDAWHKIQSGWVTPIDVIEDRLNVEIPQTEGTLREPVVLKLPANPYDIVDGTSPGSWQEYFLVENRYQTGSDYYGDPSPQGLYIYHIDNRQIRYAPRYVSTFQVEERALSVVLEQADGKNELESLTSAGGMAADPFPGTDNVRSFSQLPTLIDPSDPDLGQRWSPKSWSHGDIIDSGPLGTVVIRATTPTDSFSRVVNISDPGVNMTADVFVEPREIVVTDVSAQAAADSGPIVWPAGADITQGDRLKGLLAMKLDNPQYVPGSGDYSKMSTGEVIVSRIKILESGTAEQVQGEPHPAVERAYLYAETNGTAGLQVSGATTDSRIGTATFGNYDPDLGAQVPDYAVFTSLGYRIPADESRTIYVVYDILEDAQINPQISIGAELTDYTFIRPAAPGAVCERTRGTAKWDFGNYYFPLVSQTSLVIELPDGLVVTPNPVPDADNPLGAGIVAPDSVSQGQLDVPLLQMRMHATRDEVILRQMKVNATFGAGWIDAQEDLTVLRLYVDVDANGLVDPGSDYLLAEANFAIVGGVPQAILQLDDVSDITRRTIMADADEYWLLSVDVESDAPIGAQVQVRLETSDYITLVTNPSFPFQDYVETTNFSDDPLLTETLVKSQPATVIEPNAPPNAPTDGFSPADTPYPPAAPTVFAIISDRTPIFRWDAATDNLTDPADPASSDDPADLYYEIELATDGAMTNIIFSSNTQATPGVTQFTLPDANELPDPAGVAVDYHWRLRTVDTDGARSPASVTLHFQLIGNQAPTEPTGFFWPSGGIRITFTAPTYLWSHGTDPDTNDTFDTLRYHIQVDDNNDFSSPIVNESDIPVPALTPDGDPMTDVDPMWFEHPVDVPNGKLPLSVGVTYYWRVMTFDAQGTPSPNWSVVQVFEVVDNQAPYAPIAPFTPADDDEVNSAQPTLVWHSEVRDGHPGDPNGVHYLTVEPFPLRYHVQVIGDSGDFGQGPFIFNQDDLNDTTVPSVTVDTANNELTLALTTVTLTDNTHYRYRIRVKDSGTPELYSDWGPVQSFWVNTENDAPEPPISGFDPTGGDTIGTATPTCTWDHATDPDPTDDDTNLHYIVEFSKQAAFTTVVYQYTTAEGVNSVTLTEALEDLTTWYWRVRTVDDSGAMSIWSAVQSFIVDTTNQLPTPPVDGFIPPDGSNVSDTTPRFQWNPGTDVETPEEELHYELELATDAVIDTDSTIYSGSTLANLGATQLTLPDDEALPQPAAGETVDYYWRVRTVDGDGARSAWSGILHFILGDNNPPNSPTTGFWPSGGIQITDTTPSGGQAYRWNHATDPDANDTFDTLLYRIQVGDNADFSSTLIDVADIPVPAGTLDTDPMTFDHPLGPALVVGVTYHWRVITTDAQGATADTWSAAQAFEVVENRAPYAPIAPFTPSAEAEVTTARPTISWTTAVPPDPDQSDVLHSIDFYVQVKDSANLDVGPYAAELHKTIADDELLPGQVVIAITLDTDLQDDTQYWYRVWARDHDGTGLASDYGAIQTFWVNSENDAPLPPTSGFAPAGGANVNDDTPTCVWDYATDPDPTDDETNLHYVVQFSTDAAFASVGYQYTTAAGVNSVTVTEVLEDLTTWYWRVRTVDNSGAMSAWSTVQNFHVDTTNQIPTPPVDGFIPPDGSNVSDTTPRFQWNPGTDDTTPENQLTYEIELATDAGMTEFDGGPVYANDTQGLPGITEFTLPDADALPDPPAGTTVDYYWHVRTVDGAGALSAWSVTLHFILGDNNPPNSPTAGFWPSGGVQVTDTTPSEGQAYRWTHATDPDANDTYDTLLYRIQIDNNADFSSPLVDLANIPVPPVTQDGEPMTAADPMWFNHPAGTPLSVGVTYYWRVITSDVQGATAADWSAAQNFQVIDNRAPYAPIAPFSPTGEEEVTSERPTIGWTTATPPDPDQSDVLHTIDFYVQVKAGSNLETGPYAAELHKTIAVDELAPGQVVVTMALTADLQDDTQYWYRVRARDHDGTGLYSDWSAIQTFWVNSENDPPEPPVSGFSPTGGVNVSDDAPTCVWDHAEDADPTDDETNLHYIVQFSTSVTFASVGYQYTTADGVNSVTPTEALQDQTTWYWRVRTVDDSGAMSDWSVTQSFAVDTENQMPTPPVDGFIPPDGSNVSDTTPRFQWNPGTDDATPEDQLYYELELASDAGMTELNGGPLFSGNTQANPGDTQFTLPDANALPQPAEGTFDDYYWRVRTVDGDAARSNWSVILHFQLGDNNPPNPPTSGFWPSGGMQLSFRTPIYFWDHATDPDGTDVWNTLLYRIQVDDNDDFSSPVLDQDDIPVPALRADGQPLTASDLMWFMHPAGTPLTVGVTYNWRVMTKDTQGAVSATWSVTQTFEVVENHAPFAPIAAFTPSNDAEVNSAQPTLVWHSANPADPDINHQLMIIPFPLTYDVQIIEDTASFADGPFVFNRTNLNENSNPAVLVEVASNRLSLALTTSDLSDDTHYRYRIRVKDNGTPILASDWSAVQSFWVNTENDPPEAPASGFSPAGGVTISNIRPTCQWDHSEDPDFTDDDTNLHYILQLSTSGPATADFEANIAYQYTTALGDNQYTVTDDLDDGITWYWRVRAVDDSAAMSDWSEIQSFYLDSQNQPPNPPDTGFMPPNNSTISDRTPLFMWDPATDNLDDPADPASADDPSLLHYVLELATDAAMATDSIIYTGDTQATPGDTQLVLPDANALPDPLDQAVDYYWRLYTVDTDGALSPASIILHFQLVANRPPNPPTDGFWPSGGIQVADVTPTYRWNHATDPDANDTYDTLRYDIQIDDNNDFSSPLVSVQGIPVPPDTEPTDPVTFAHPAGTPLTVGVVYFWRVMTRDAQDATSDQWSATQNFEVVQNRAPYAPIAPFSPADGEEVTTQRPTISWETADPPDPDVRDELRSIDFYLQIKDDANLDEGPYVVDMRIQLSEDDITPGDFTVSVALTQDLEDNTQYWYRVRARDLDGTGRYSDWSPIQNFWVNTVNDNPEKPRSGFRPNNGVTISDSTPTFYWSHSEDPDPYDDETNMEYILQISRVGTSQEDFADAMAYQYTTDTNSVTATEPLEDLTTWYWRVRARDDSGALSQWSDIQDFYLDTNNSDPLLLDGSVIEPYGYLENYYEYHVTYQDAENDPPGWVHVTIDLGESREQTLPMVKVNAGDNDYVTGVEYSVGVAGADLGYGAHTWVFTSENGARLPATPPDTGAGPVIGTDAILRLVDAAWADADQYEETATVYIQVNDPDENLDPTFRETIHVALYDVNQTDTEVVALRERGVNDNIFRGSIPLRGAPGANDDGYLNVIAGAAGVEIVAHYFDKDDANNPTPDERQDTAMVVDTVGPSPVNNPVNSLIVTSGINGRSAELDWTAYDEEAEIDVAGYRIYYGENPFGNTGDPDAQLYADVVAGSQRTITITGLTPDVRYYFAVVAYDEVPNPPADAAVLVNTVTVITRDTSGPLITDFFPADGALDVPLDTQISFRVADDGTGVDLDTLDVEVTVDGNALPIDIDTDDQGTYFDVTVQPTDPFNWNDEVTVNVEISDNVPAPDANTATAQWSFDVVTDNVAPVISNMMPADDAIEVALGTSITFRVSDAGSGVDLSTLDVQVTVNGDPVGVQVNIDDQGTFIQVDVVPDDPFGWNDTVAVNVEVSDNVLAPDTNTASAAWSFKMVTDTVNPVVERQDPEDEATGVAVSLPITFHLTDDNSGVNVGTLVVTLNGTDITADVTTNEVNGTRDIGCSYTAPDGLQYNTTYTVVVSVSDHAGNPSGDSTWSFATVEDGTGVLIDQFRPERDATDVPIDTNISMRMTDTQAGVNADSIRLWVEGVEVTDQLTKTIEDVSVTVEYNPTDDFPYSTDIFVRVYVEDNIGNVTDMTYKFTTVEPVTYVITGRVLTAQDAPVAGVTITCNGNKATTDGNGSYVLSGILEGTYTVTPTKDEWLFDPVSREVSVGPDDASDIDFTGTLVTYEIRGRATDRDGNGVTGVTIACSGADSVQTDADGNYVIEGLRRGQYTLTPSLQYHHFEPVNRVIEIVDADIAGADFTVIPDTFSISGTVCDSADRRVQGVQVTNGDSIAVTDIAGRYTLSNLEMRTHILTASKVGYKLLVAGADPPLEQLTVELPPDYDGADFTAYYELSNSFPAGFNLIGVPGTPIHPNPTLVFATDSVARWNPNATPPAYVLGSTHGDTDFMRVRPAYGYFVRFDNPTDISIAAEPTDTGRAVSIGVGLDWNMIANPFANPTPFANFQPTIAGGIRPYAYVYNNATGSYELVSSRASINAIRDNLQPWEAAWVLCVAGGTSVTIIPPVATTATDGKVEPADIGAGYVIPVVASANGRSDTCSVAGVIPNAGADHALLNPPTAPATVDVYFVNDSGLQLSRDIRDHNKLADTFDFVVSSAVGPANVTVALPDLSTVPHNYEVMLTDLDADKTIYARTMQSYTYRCAEQAGLRHFRIAVQSRTVGSLNIATAAAAQQGGAAVITYSTSQACRVSVTIRNIAGRRVKVLAADKVTSAGLQTETWNLSSEAGTKVPAGSYLIEIQARADNGQQARAMTRINLTR